MKYHAMVTTLCISLSTMLMAEIQMVSFTWAPQVCQATCAQGLQKQLSAIPQVAHADVNQNAATATLTWRPNQPYSFSPINFASRVIGIPRILTARLRVRGTIQHSQDVINIQSSGDNTIIRLLGPIQPEPGRFTIQSSLDNHRLSPSMKQKLLEIENKHQTVIIEGPIFEPVRLTFPAVIIETITVEKKEKDQK